MIIRMLALCFALSVSVSIQAAEIPMKPGLWEISTQMKSGDAQVDPQAEIKKAMAGMSPEQRKQMSAAMAKAGMDLGALEGKGMRVCYTRELLAESKNLGQSQDRHCESTVKEQSSKRMVLEFKCQDGGTGRGEWNFRSPTQYDGAMKFKDKDGRASEVIQQGRFLGADCGAIKPFAIPKG